MKVLTTINVDCPASHFNGACAAIESPPIEKVALTFNISPVSIACRFQDFCLKIRPRRLRVKNIIHIKYFQVWIIAKSRKHSLVGLFLNSCNKFPVEFLIVAELTYIA